MKALSLTQPMAWAIFHGKDVENRSWNTYYRGPLLIHASKGFDRGHYKWLSENVEKLGIALPQREEFVHGALLGTVNLVRVMQREIPCQLGVHAPSIGDQQRELEYLKVHDSHFYSLWFFGPYGFVLSNAVEYETPIPCKGMLGFFEPQIRFGE